jgi:hypothetical protein
MLSSEGVNASAPFFNKKGLHCLDDVGLMPFSTACNQAGKVLTLCFLRVVTLVRRALRPAAKRYSASFAGAGLPCGRLTPPSVSLGRRIR